MSNKRDLKRTINYICGDLFAEALAASLYGSNVNKEDVEALLTSILILRNNYISRVSHIEPGMKSKLYFNDLKYKFNEEVSEIIDQITNLG
ncbi:hypothetical protein ETF27_00445 [Prevotella brunnea]|uniref:Uncharacterized protein n=1 Tax=Prevotella brunnea TaxID=2508867 RepID=A0A5C8GMI4_9BACT|nr:hypothetical protein [Prevotella brunnea]MDR0186488.1 hypothetical protein [Prevotella brunnea]TXJ63380.1 hypothetical protein ETF27_00445 [Prevotella brunnea]